MTAPDFVPPPSEAEPSLQVLVIVDRQERARGIHWVDEVAIYNSSHLSDGGRKANCELLSLADEIARPLTSETKEVLERIEQAQLVILNWDVANGDPNFGADAAQRWFTHHVYNLRDWVKRGGILVVEGQANLGIPSQEAYDAILGDREVRVCGNNHPLEVMAELGRVGVSCKFTKVARRSELFRSYRSFHLEPSARQYNDYFLTQSLIGRYIVSSRLGGGLFSGAAGLGVLPV